MEVHEMEIMEKSQKPHKSEWIDVSWPLRNGMTVFEKDNPPTEIEPYNPPTFDFIHPDKNTTVVGIKMLVHTGTHIDAPRHIKSDGEAIDGMPVDAIIGPARVLEIDDPVSIKTEALKGYDIQPGERILLKTLNSDRCYRKDGFIKDYVYISTEAAQFLREKKVSVVGIDYIASGNYDNIENNMILVHEILLGNGIWLLEGINLSEVKPGPCEVICLPLRIENGDAGPARCLVRPL
jgi:arylformamidase